MPKKVFISRQIPAKGVHFLQEQGHTVEINTKGPMDPSELDSAASKADALIVMLSDKIDAQFLMRNRHLKVIANYAVGYNNIDITTAAQLGIEIGNTPDVLTEATADLALALLLNITRRVNEAYTSVQGGDWSGWEPMGFLGMALRDKVLGVVGLGRIGEELARKCHAAFGMRILYSGHSHKRLAERELGAKKVEFDTLLKESDVITLHCPLSDEVRGLFNQQSFSKMKKRAYFINTARGEMHDESALYNALKGPLAGAGLDVTNPEPMSPSSPLLGLPNCLVTPHIGSATLEAREAMSLLAAQNVHNALTGKPLIAPVRA